MRPRCTFTHLPNGQADSDGFTNAPLDRLQLGYNAVNRLETVDKPLEPVATYVYNARGQRAVKSLASPGGIPPQGPETHYIYDLRGHVIAEVDSSGAPGIDYLWLGDLPLALSKGDGFGITIDYIHADHLGTPQKMTSSAQSLVWDAIYRPFGELELVIGTETTNLRFAGQYFDAETGYHQNWFRQYDPSAGRFLQTDPIGLLGGINQFAYVDNNPNGLIDPDGRLPVVPVVIAAVVVAGGSYFLGDLWRDFRTWRSAQKLQFPITSENDTASNINKRDSWQHCASSCNISRKYGQPVAHLCGWANELWADEENGDITERTQDGRADEYNNASGREFGISSQSRFDCYESCRRAVIDGVLESIHN